LAAEQMSVVTNRRYLPNSFEDYGVVRTNI